MSKHGGHIIASMEEALAYAEGRPSKVRVYRPSPKEIREARLREITMPIEGAEEYETMLWIDVESSGLHDGSYPIEIGWCGASLESTAFLIRPVSSWTAADWSPASERMHGISRQRLVQCGQDPVDVGHWLNAACSGKTVLSDNPSHDARWLDRLYDDVGILREFDIQDAVHAAGVAAGLSRISQEEADSILARIYSKFPHPHRAGPDSRRSAAAFLAMAMPWQLQEIEGSA